jgi:hypothetical protein
MAILPIDLFNTEVQRHRVFIISPYLSVHQNTACGLQRYPNSVFHPMEQVIPPHGTSYSTLWNKVFHPMEQSIPPHGTNRKVPPSWEEGAAFLSKGYCSVKSGSIFHIMLLPAS